MTRYHPSPGANYIYIYARRSPKNKALQQRKHDFSDREMSMHVPYQRLDATRRACTWNILIMCCTLIKGIILQWLSIIQSLPTMCVKDNVAHFHHLACIEGAVKTAVLFHILDSIRAWAASGLLAAWHTHAQRTESDGQTGGI